MSATLKAILQFLSVSKLLDDIFRVLQSQRKGFHTYYIRDEIQSHRIDFANDEQRANELSNTLIILQGPICTNQNFTLDSINRYQNYYPECQIVLSTWIGEDQFICNDWKKRGLINENNFEVLFNKPPDSPGISNINMQIISTNAGIQYGISKKIKYVFKTRTDQAFNSPTSIDSLFNLLNCFENKDKKNRIVAFSLNTFLFRLYGVSDMAQFGTIDSIGAYWNVGLDLRSLEDIDQIEQWNENLSMYNQSRRNTCETYLMTSYLQNLGVTLGFTLKHSLEMINDYFIIADSEFIDLTWSKYTNCGNRWRGDAFPSPYTEISFGIWLQLHRKSDYFKSYENLIYKSIKNGNFLN